MRWENLAEIPHLESGISKAKFSHLTLWISWFTINTTPSDDELLWLRPTNRSNKTLIYLFSVTKQRLVMCAEEIFNFFTLCYTAAVCFQQCSGVDSCSVSCCWQCSGTATLSSWRRSSSVILTRILPDLWCRVPTEHGILCEIPCSGQSMEFCVKSQATARAWNFVSNPMLRTWVFILNLIYLQWVFYQVSGIISSNFLPQRRR